MSPTLASFTRVVGLKGELSINLLGVRFGSARSLKIKLSHGRFLSPLETIERHCVVGSELFEFLQEPLAWISYYYTAGDLYADRSLKNLEAQWVLSPRCESGRDTSPSCLRRHGVQEGIRNFLFALEPKGESNSSMDAAIDKITTQFGRWYPNVPTNVRSAKILLEKMHHQARILEGLLILIGALSLWVGGIGIVNVMLANVAERREEIGLRKVLGLPPRYPSLFYAKQFSSAP